MDFAVVDSAIQISDAQAIHTCHVLSKQLGMLVGGSSGLNVAAAQEVAKSLTEPAVIVTVCPDHGLKYLSKYYNAEWLEKMGVKVDDANWMDGKRYQDPVFHGPDEKFPGLDAAVGKGMLAVSAALVITKSALDLLTEVYLLISNRRWKAQKAMFMLRESVEVPAASSPAIILSPISRHPATPSSQNPPTPAAAASRYTYSCTSEPPTPLSLNLYVPRTPASYTTLDF
eukprot:Sspe_Gene.1485::Locus_488_Transcript_4_4_Confidence_0.400_Length_2013::g.1485::m.1485